MPPPAAMTGVETSVTDTLTKPAPAAAAGHGQADPRRQEHRGHLRPRHPGAEGRVAGGAGGRHRRHARRQRRRQVDHAEVDLQPGALRARRGHQGLDRVQGRARRRPDAQRPGAARLHPGDGGPPLLRPSDRRGEPADRRLHAPRRARRDRRRPRDGLRLFPAPQGAAHVAGRLHLRRRAADDGDRPRADVAADHDPARRALDGAGAADRRADLRDRAATSTARSR